MGWENRVWDANERKGKAVAWHWKMTETQWGKWRSAEPERGSIWDGMRLLKAAGWRCHIEKYEKTGSQWMLIWPPGEKLYRLDPGELDRRFYAELRRIITPKWFELHGSKLSFP